MDLLKHNFPDTLYFTSNYFKDVCFVLSILNKRALCASDCKMSWYSSIDSLAHTAENKLLVVRKQTSR